MNIGFCSRFDEGRIRFARDAGFDGLEIGVGPGSPLDPATVTDDEVKRAKETLARYGVEALTVFHGPNYADPDPSKREAAAKGLVRTMEIAKMLGTEIVTLNAWVPRDESFEGKLAFYRKTFGAFAKDAEDRGVRLAIENCPHGWANIASCPAHFTAIFEAVPSKAIGLEFDPSHLVWQGIDYVQAILDFGDRIYAFHAKDTQIRDEILYQQGYYGKGWWRFRIPGWGDIDWQQVFVALSDIGYEGDVSIEHEDPVFGGARTDEGLKLGLKTLKQFVA